MALVQIKNNRGITNNTIVSCALERFGDAVAQGRDAKVVIPYN